MDSPWPAPAGIPDTDDVRTIALLSLADFAHARAVISEFDRWSDFEDYCLERDGEFLALSSAGVAVCQQRVLLCAFCRWVRLTGAEQTLADLDVFAAKWRTRRAHPNWPVRGALVPQGASAATRISFLKGSLVIPIAQHLHANWDGSVSSLKLFRSGNSVDQHAVLIAETCLARRSNRRLDPTAV